MIPIYVYIYFISIRDKSYVLMSEYMIVRMIV
jgi:hypothetical protein